jgi:hypothetical protein
MCNEKLISFLHHKIGHLTKDVHLLVFPLNHKTNIYLTKDVQVS